MARYDDNNKPATGGLDFSHLNGKNIAAEISNFIFSKDSTGGFVKQLSFRDSAGFILDTTHTDLLMTKTGIIIKEFTWAVFGRTIF